MQRILFTTLLLVMSVALATPLPAASAETTVLRIPTVTRWVKVFSELEFQLSEAVHKRDSQAIAGLLDDDFEMRVGAMPGSPIPRAAWIRQALAGPRLTSTLEQMAVHDYGKLAIVSFLWTVTPDGQPGGQRQLFVVDTWRQDAGGWKLAVRYASPGGKSDIAVPAGNPVVPPFEKKE